MIICFNKKINTFFKIYKNNFSFTQENVQNIMPNVSDIKCKCPKCKTKSNFSYHGSYLRNISFINDNGIFECKVSVSRAICNSCGSTHALLPSFIVPYRIFSMWSILYVISKAFSSSVTFFSQKLNISIELIYSFLALILSFFDFADSLNREYNFFCNFNKKYFILNCFSICDDKFCISFFYRYKWLFLMSKFRNIKPPPIYISINFSSPHNF